MTPQPRSPLLDVLLPLRHAQFLQIVVRQVKAAGGVEAGKRDSAEVYLSRCDGDYETMCASFLRVPLLKTCLNAVLLAPSATVSYTLAQPQSCR